MNDQQRISTQNLQYSESEYSENQDEYDLNDLAWVKNAPTAAGSRHSHSTGNDHTPQRQRNRSSWRRSETSNRDISDTEDYLRRNGFDLGTGLGLRYLGSYTPPTEASGSSGASDHTRPLLPSQLHIHPLLRSPTTPEHHKQYASLQAKSSPLQGSQRQAYWNGERRLLAPLPLDIHSITAAKHKTSAREIRKYPRGSSEVPRRDSHISSQQSSPLRPSFKKPSLDPLEPDLDEEVLDELPQRSSRKPQFTQNILSVTDLRPAQATRDPSQILHFQVVPNQPSPLRTTQSTQELAADYSIGRYVADPRPAISTTVLPLQARFKTTKKERSMGVMRGFMGRVKKTLVGSERR